MVQEFHMQADQKRLPGKMPKNSSLLPPVLGVEPRDLEEQPLTSYAEGGHQGSVPCRQHATI